MKKEAKVKPILVLGVGNLLLKDEGAGVHFVEAFQKQELPPDVEVMEGGARGIDLLPFFEGRKLVVIVDCARMGEPPGTVRTFEASEIIAREGASFSAHGMSLANTLRLGQKLGVLPDIVIVGIEPETVDISIGLTEVVSGAVDRVTRLVREIIQSRS